MIAYFLGGCAIYGLLHVCLGMPSAEVCAAYKKAYRLRTQGEDHHRRGVSDPDSALHTADGAGAGLERGRPGRDESV